jgi:hypothetical protein
MGALSTELAGFGFLGIVIRDRGKARAHPISTLSG